MNFSSKRHFFGATRFFRVDKGALPRCYFCFLDSHNTSLTALDLLGNNIGDAGASSIGAGLAYGSFCSFGWTFVFTSRHPKFFGLIMGLINVWFCLILSQNASLTQLLLWGNTIGAVGASGLSAGLAYVSFFLCGWTFVPMSCQPFFSDW